MRRSAKGELEFAPVNGKELFLRSMGKQTDVEWLLAESVNPEEASIAGVDSAEAGTAPSKSTLTLAVAAVPGTNTLVRRLFRFSYLQVFEEPIFWFGAGFFVLLATGSFVIGKKVTPAAFSSTEDFAANSKKDGKKRPRLQSGKFFLERLHSCVKNEFIEYQCVILLAPDRAETLPSREKEGILLAVTQELNVVCQHGPLPAIIDWKAAKSNGSEEHNRAPMLFGIHCPNFGAKTALEFAARIRNHLESRPEMLLKDQPTTFSAAIAEFHRKADLEEDSQAVVMKLLDAAAFALRSAQDEGGATLILADNLRFTGGESS